MIARACNLSLILPEKKSIYETFLEEARTAVWRRIIDLIEQPPRRGRKWKKRHEALIQIARKVALLRGRYEYEKYTPSHVNCMCRVKRIPVK